MNIIVFLLKYLLNCVGINTNISNMFVFLRFKYLRYIINV